jgi:hypothetical protein
MSGGVIDDLELVKIDVEESMVWLFGFSGLGNALAQADFKRPPIEKSGQVVMVCLEENLGIQGHFGGDILNKAQEVGDSAGFIPLGDLAALANAGTLVAFASVGLCLIVLRRREPGRPRVFRAPAWWLVGPVAIAGCVYLFFSLPASTQINFVIWNVIGVAVYLLYSRRNSLLNG